MDAWFQEKLMMLSIMAIFAVIDMLGGVVVSFKTGAFQLEKLPEFVKTFAANAWAWASIELISFLPVYFGVVIDGLPEILAMYGGGAIYAFIMLKYVASIIGHLQNLDALPPGLGQTIGKIGIPPAPKG